MRTQIDSEPADIACRLCGEETAMQSLGPLPDSRHFAGSYHNVTIVGGRLYLCGKCESMQRHPIYSEEQYLSWYENGSGDIWTQSDKRNDNLIIRDFVSKHPSIKTMLDVGCSCGDLLLQMPEQIKAFGIEPSEEAKAVASSRGIEIVGRDISELDGNDMYDCIAAVDVIEHIGDPRQLFENMLKLTNKNGFIIISTGNPRAKIWIDILKNKFWYSSFAEHISFPSAKVLEIWSKQHGAKIFYSKNFKYSRNSLVKLFYQFILQATFFLSTNINRFFVNKLLGLKSKAFREYRFFVPCSGLFKDHQIIVIQKLTL